MKTPEEIAETILAPAFNFGSDAETIEQKAIAEIRQAIEAAREEGRREGWEKGQTEIIDGITEEYGTQVASAINTLPYNPNAFKTP